MAIQQNTTQRQAATPQPEKGNDLKGEWKTFLDQPENRAALLQFGISMLNPQSKNLGANIGSSIGQGMEARDRVISQEAGQQETALKAQNIQSQINYRNALAKKVGRAPVGKSGAATQWTQKDMMREYVKFAKEARELDPDKPISEIKAEYDEIVGAVLSPTEAAPAAGGADPIAAAVLKESGKGSFDEMTPEELAAASARYKALQQAK